MPEHSGVGWTRDWGRMGEAHTVKGVFIIDSADGIQGVGQPKVFPKE